ncbi:DUF4411 family protein [Leifsonia sp. ZF2019]|nr:DUF4411 family protein [Leifsonia sp. ZF2019]
MVARRGRCGRSFRKADSAGESCICEAILREVHRGGDPLYERAKKLPGFVCPVTDAELLTVAQLGADHPGWVQGQLNEADPFIIAHAKAEGSIVVTEENRKGPKTEDRNQKMGVRNVLGIISHAVSCVASGMVSRRLISRVKSLLVDVQLRVVKGSCVRAPFISARILAKS